MHSFSMFSVLNTQCYLPFECQSTFLTWSFWCFFFAIWCQKISIWHRCQIWCFLFFLLLFSQGLPIHDECTQQGMIVNSLTQLRCRTVLKTDAKVNVDLVNRLHHKMFKFSPFELGRSPSRSIFDLEKI